MTSLQNDHFTWYAEEPAQVSNIRFRDVVIGQHGREGEEEQGHRNKRLADAGHDALNGHLCKGGTLRVNSGRQVLNNETAVATVHVVGARDQYHECGCRTDEQGIDINRERLYQALLCRMLHFRC